MSETTRVRIPISLPMLREILRLPEAFEIRDLVWDRPDWVDVVADVQGAPEGAVMAEPVYSHAAGWPDPIHLCGVQWFDADGARIEAPGE